MAETLISPGVLARENDQSQITSQPVQAGAAIIGPTVKGRVNIPTLVTTYSEYLANFGSTFTSASDEYSFLTSISAYNYFQNGGTSLLVTRVASGSFTSATSSQITNNETVIGGVKATGSNDLSLTTNFGTVVDDELRFAYDGTTYRFVAADPGSGGVPQDQAPLYFVATGSNSANFVSQLATKIDSVLSSLVDAADEGASVLAISSSNAGTNFNGVVVQTGSVSDFSTAFTLGGGVASIGNGNAFTLETIGEGEIMNSTSTEGTNGSLPSGSVDNLRWEIVNPDTANGVFSVVVRRGNDTTKNKSVLETFTNVSLDPKSPNYVARVIGDQKLTMRGAGTSDPYLQVTGSYPNASRYVRVKSVNTKTPDYFDNNGIAKDQYTSSIPLAQSGTFGDATGDILTGTGKYYNNINSVDTQGLVADNYTDAINLLANKDDYRYNIITTPGLIYDNTPTPLNTLVSNVENRGDAIIVMDLKNYGSTVVGATTTAASIDSSYAASYWPWVQITDPDSGQLVWVPASTMIPGVYANNDRTSEAWFAPAGINRGGLGNVRQAERKLTQANRDTLYTGKVNPIATFPGRGVVVFGQKTLQTQASALDRVNVRRLLIELKSYISQISDNLVFEQNTAATRNQFLSQVNPYLESVQQRQGLYAFKVVMDDSNNTADVIDRNQLVGAIYIQPTKTAEFIYLDFNILPTGATFPA